MTMKLHIRVVSSFKAQQSGKEKGQFQFLSRGNVSGNSLDPWRDVNADIMSLAARIGRMRYRYARIGACTKHACSLGSDSETKVLNWTEAYLSPFATQAHCKCKANEVTSGVAMSRQPLHAELVYPRLLAT